MGCDIHPYFETRQPDGTWAPTFAVGPSEWWYEELLDKRIEDGSVITAFGPPTQEEIDRARSERQVTINGQPASDEYLAEGILYQKAKKHFETMPPDAVMAQYSADPDFQFSFYPPEVCRELSSNFRYPDIRSRNYEWFGALQPEVAGYRGGKPLFEARDIPGDCSPLIAREIERWSGDGHSHSWLMVSEILAQKSLARFEHYRWLAKHITDPENTRMIFFFDN